MNQDIFKSWVEMKDMIIFDGECNFCIGQIQKIKSRSKSDQFDYLPRKADNLLNMFPELVPFEMQDGLRFLNYQKKVFVGPDAVYQIYKRISPFNFIAWVYRLPIFNWFCKLIYKIIAKNRYKLAGKCEKDICAVPYQQREE